MCGAHYGLGYHSTTARCYPVGVGLHVRSRGHVPQCIIAGDATAVEYLLCPHTSLGIAVLRLLQCQ